MSLPAANILNLYTTTLLVADIQSLYTKVKKQIRDAPHNANFRKFHIGSSQAAS